MTKKAQKSFARRFTLDDWQHLSGKIEFLEALDEKTEAECELIALRLLAELHPVLP